MPDRILRSQTDIVTFPIMAMDAAPTGGRGGARDQGNDPDADIRIANSPTEAVLMRLHSKLAGLLAGDDLAEVEELVGQLVAATAPTNGNNGANSPGMAGDARRRGLTYAERYPNAGRLLRRSF